MTTDNSDMANAIESTSMTGGTPNYPDTVHDTNDCGFLDETQPCVWRVFYASEDTSSQLITGDKVGIRAKLGTDAYRFINSDNAVFDDVIWSREARGLFESSDNITIKNSKIVRDPFIFDEFGERSYLSTPSGGPQIGRTTARVGGSNHLIDNNVFQATGDDALGVFEVSNLDMTDNSISSSFGRAVFNFHPSGTYTQINQYDGTLNDPNCNNYTGSNSFNNTESDIADTHPGPGSCL